MEASLRALIVGGFAVRNLRALLNKKKVELPGGGAYDGPGRLTLSIWRPLVDPNNPHTPYTIPWDRHERQVKEQKRQEDERYRRNLESFSSPSTSSGSTGSASIGAGWTGGHSGSSHSSSSGSGLLDGPIEAGVDAAAWFVDHIWPLRLLKDFGLRLSRTTNNWKLNAPLALVGAFLLPAMMMGPDAAFRAAGAWLGSVAGGAAGPIFIALGGAAGWFAVPMVGIALGLTAILIGLAITLGLVAGALWLAWQALSQL